MASLHRDGDSERSRFLFYKSRLIDAGDALPAGNYNGSFNDLGSNANFWTSSENGSNNAYNRNFNTGASMNSNNNNKNNQYSVRLVKDNGVVAGTPATIIFMWLSAAYREARRHKRNTKSQLLFEAHLERNLIRLSRELAEGTYRISPSRCFINDRPVKREVIAADFRDRVVQHMLCAWLFPIFERQFIYDSYSCRREKGTLFGINRVRGFIRAASDDFRKDCWVLRLDIKGFFMSIKKDILYELVLDGLRRGNYRGVDDINLCNKLVHDIIYRDPIKDAIFCSPPEKWDGLPPDKTMRNGDGSKGLPIGNLTSQLFGNVYLNPLDQYIKRELKIKHYGRYVDDMVLVHQDPDVLRRTIPEIRSFLADTLGLTLHPRKISLQPAAYGFSFIGAYIKPYHVLPTSRLRGNLNVGLSGSEYDIRREILARSYRGLFKYFNGMPAVLRPTYKRTGGH